ncbi:MAG: hypothetical protein JSV67_05720 [Thermoplasmatales archaeon]|nr:MAG: hypothetical protein JSV67_05720 [Thermoplasmatales archaeon]
MFTKKLIGINIIPIIIAIKDFNLGSAIGIFISLAKFGFKNANNPKSSTIIPAIDNITFTSYISIYLSFTAVP